MRPPNAIPLISAVGLLLSAGCAINGELTDDERNFGSRLPAEFIDNNGESVGSAMLTETANGVLMDVELRELEPGWHGFHIHERGDCSDPDFKSAGGHYEPDDNAHGFMEPEGAHAGDLPNIFVSMDGDARFQVVAPNVSLRSGNALLDDDGSAIMVHSGEDDYRSQPSGDAGTRVACAEVDSGID